MNRDELGGLLAEGESPHLDWKRDFPAGLIGGSSHADWLRDRGKMLKSLIALANSHGSEYGFLIYGVEDTGSTRTVRGISTSFDDADFQQWAQNAFDPPPTFVYTEVEWEAGKTVGVFRIERTPDYPHVAKITWGPLMEGQIWYRRGTKNTVALHGDIRQMFQGDVPFKISRSNDAALETIAAHYREQGRETVLPRMEERDSKLAAGYELATYPGTRREVWVCARSPDAYEHILMVKPLGGS